MCKSIFHLLLFVALTACTIRPQGETEERQAAQQAGKSFASTRQSPLANKPTRDDLVRYALANNAELQQQYWQWRSAIEQIPIDGTQATNLAISLGTVVNNGQWSLDRSTIGVGNDPMADIVLPPKLSTAAKRSLENARAAGIRFRKAQLELRAKVISAYDDYSLTAETIRLGERNVQLLQTIVTITEARSRIGMAGQQDVLKVENDLDMAKNDVAAARSRLPIMLASLNAALNRDPADAIPVPDSLPGVSPVTDSDQALLDRAAQANPELVALADEMRAKNEDIRLAKYQYIPDISVSASTDLEGMAQSLLGSFTVPFLRYEAIEAAVKQAEDNLRANEAARQQTSRDIGAQLIGDVVTVHDADRQLKLLNDSILPRARQAISLSQTAYQTGNSTLRDLLDTQRSLIELERFGAELTITRDKRLADIESVTGLD
jgi:outer membrane protein TolC